MTRRGPGGARAGREPTGREFSTRVWPLLADPAVPLPLLPGAAGLPVGVQLVGPRHNDGQLLRTARWLVNSLASTD